MFFNPKNLKSENNSPWFNTLLHTQSIVCATADGQCLEYLGYITLGLDWCLHFYVNNGEKTIKTSHLHSAFPREIHGYNCVDVVSLLIYQNYIAWHKE